MRTPLVSIIVPAYNAKKFVEETIQSALDQTYKNIEVIVADDGSTDGTGEIVKGLIAKDTRVKYVYQKNAGQSAARNAGIAAAKGEYVAFLDADDLFMPEKISRQVASLEANPEYGVSYCKIYHFFDDKPDEKYWFEVPHPSGEIFPNLLRANFINPLSVVLKKSLLDKWGAFEPTFRRVDEQYLWLKLSYRGAKFLYLDEPSALYRVHRKSLSNDPEYFEETEAQFLKLLEIMRGWMTEEEMRRYALAGMEKRTRKRLFAGKILAMRNPLSRLLLELYFLKRKSRLRRVG